MPNDHAITTYAPLDIFEKRESEVRSYIRSFPTVFSRAQGSRMWDMRGREYVDFFSGAGALNYGHNNPKLKELLIAYLQEDGITHSLDMATKAKAKFLETFQSVILEPRDLPYKVMFPGPTGTNAVESALKLARKVTGRQTVIAFTNAFHGMTLGSLAVTANRFKRRGAGVPLGHAVIMPYDQFLGEAVDAAAYLEQFLEEGGSGVSRPAAIILETVQGEGGVHVARTAWLKKIGDLCKRMGILLIVDDVQVGCGRTGPFFSFEEAGITPDIVSLSKSISGYGLAMALTLMKPELDVFEPGEHNGTFRGQNPAFVTATGALDYWRTADFTAAIGEKAALMRTRLEKIACAYPLLNLEVRGRGLIQGIVSDSSPELASQISQEAFSRGLIVETSGPEDEVVKLLPALTIDDETLVQGLNILEDSIRHIIDNRGGNTL